MALIMKPGCERCGAPTPADADQASQARICSYECTFCKGCADAMDDDCPNCGGVLVVRPRRELPSGDS